MCIWYAESGDEDTGGYWRVMIRMAIGRTSHTLDAWKGPGDREFSKQEYSYIRGQFVAIVI